MCATKAVYAEQWSRDRRGRRRSTTRSRARLSLSAVCLATAGAYRLADVQRVLGVLRRQVRLGPAFMRKLAHRSRRAATLLAVTTLVALLIVVATWAIWKGPAALHPPLPRTVETATLEASARSTIVTALLGVAAVVGAVFTGRTYLLARQGHITDRYTKAIGQLGDGQLEIRLGGIYALERIAIDSARDHSTIVEVLSAYIRERTRKPPIPSPPVEDPAGGPTEEDGEPETDVQAALTVLARLPEHSGVPRGHLETERALTMRVWTTHCFRGRAWGELA
jgi:hypothetical protein